jgi:hypothetical protein
VHKKKIEKFAKQKCINVRSDYLLSGKQGKKNNFDDLIKTKSACFENIRGTEKHGILVLEKGKFFLTENE